MYKNKKAAFRMFFLFLFYGTHESYDIECNSLKTAFAIKVRHILVINNIKQRCRQKAIIYILIDVCLRKERILVGLPINFFLKSKHNSLKI